MPPRKRLGQLLTELGVVDEHQLQSALGHQKQWGGKLGAILVQKGFCKEEEVVSALSRHLGMPRVRLSEQKVDPRAIKFVAKPIAEKLHVFAYEVSGSGRSEVVTIAMSDPTDLSAVDQLAFHTGKRIKPMLAGDSEIVSAIAEHYGAEEKPRAAPAVAPPVVPQTAPSAPSGPFGRRVDPPATRTPPGLPRLTPVMTPVWSPATVAEAPPPAPSAPPRSPVDLPAADDDKLALEPIAAHSQTEEVQGQTDFSGTGSAADRVEGLEPAGNAQAAAQENWSSGGWDSGQGWGASPDSASPSQDWAAPPAEPLPDWGDQPAEAAWGAPPQEPASGGHGEDAPLAAQEEQAAHAEEMAHEAQPETAAFDAPAEEAAPDVEPEAAYDALPEEAAGEPQPHEVAEEALPEESAHELADEALPEETSYEAQAAETGPEHSGHEAPAQDAGAAHAAGEELPVDAILGTAEDSHRDFSAADAEHPADDEAQRAADEPHHAEHEAHHAEDESAEAPDAWGATEDPLAAQDASGWNTGDAAQSAADAFAEASHDAFDPAAAQHSSDEAAEEQGFDIEESEPAAPEDANVEWETAAPPDASETAAGDATVDMAPVAQAPAAEGAEGAYAPAALAYASEDPEARPAEVPTTPVFGMVSTDEAAAPEHGASGEGFAAHAAAAEGGEEVAEAGEVPVEWSEPPRAEEAPGHAAAGDTAAPENPGFAPQEHADFAPQEHADFAPQEHADFAPQEPGGFTAHEHAESAHEEAADFIVEEQPADAQGWGAPAAESHGEAWSTEPPAPAGELSAQDLTTLASAGIDPHDGAAALRLLASLVRALERKGVIELAELAAEVQESTAQPADAADDVPPV